MRKSCASREALHRSVPSAASQPRGPLLPTPACPPPTPPCPGPELLGTAGWESLKAVDIYPPFHSRALTSRSSSFSDFGSLGHTGWFEESHPLPPQLCSLGRVLNSDINLYSNPYNYFV